MRRMASMLSSRNARLNESIARIIQSRAMPHPARAALGSLIGAAMAACLAPLIRPLFHPPAGGVGFVTVAGYPKAWDYAVVALLVLGAAVGSWVLGVRGEGSLSRGTPSTPNPRTPNPHHARRVRAHVVHPRPPLRTHGPLPRRRAPHARLLVEERRAAVWRLLRAARFATDGALDALVLGDPPSPRRVRRLQTVLDAATLALLVPIAAEVRPRAPG